MLKYKADIMNDFLTDCISNETELTIYLTNKKKLEGLIRNFDNEVITLEDHGHYSMIVRKNISTIKYLEDSPLRDFCDEMGICEPDSLRIVPLRERFRRWLKW